jgi:hypothetical protein
LAALVLAIVIVVLIMAVSPTVIMVIILVVVMMAPALVVRRVFCRPNKIHGAITGVIGSAVPAPIAGMSRWHV